MRTYSVWRDRLRPESDEPIPVRGEDVTRYDRPVESRSKEVVSQLGQAYSSTAL